jgi:hypothetical protein
MYIWIRRRRAYRGPVSIFYRLPGNSTRVGKTVHAKKLLLAPFSRASHELCALWHCEWFHSLRELDRDLFERSLSPWSRSGTIRSE